MAAVDDGSLARVAVAVTASRVVMPKWTRKYREAFDLADQLLIAERDNQDSLYRLLNEAGFYWDFNAGAWYRKSNLQSRGSYLVKTYFKREPTGGYEVFLYLRRHLERQGYLIAEDSLVYIYQPPKQLISRVYITFK